METLEQGVEYVQNQQWRQYSDYAILLWCSVETRVSGKHVSVQSQQYRH